MKPKKINPQIAKNIIEKRSPLGMFYFKENDVFIGIDNTCGESFVEEFKDEKICLSWLNQDIMTYHTEQDFHKSLKELKLEDEKERENPNHYEVIITETLVKSVSIVAHSEDEALYKAERSYDNEKYILDFNDFNDVSFHIDK